MPIILFFIGLFIGCVFMFVKFVLSNFINIKVEVSAWIVPLFFLIAAAVAKYIGL
jgi:surface polysaccharide O-acyltransferase-like enzyme